MRIVRDESRLRLDGFVHVMHDCLEVLALEEGFRVDGVCERLGVSRAYLREMFHRDVGISPKRWMQGERLALAREMVSAGVDAWEITSRLGFSHPNSLRREFVRSCGVTPRLFLGIGGRVEGLKVEGLKVGEEEG